MTEDDETPEPVPTVDDRESPRRSEHHNNEDWLVPAILIASLVIVVAIVVVFIVSTSSSSQADERPADALETWSTCLRDEGAPVPLIEAVGDEGFRITVDDGVIDADIAPGDLQRALEACVDEAPPRLRRWIAMIERFTPSNGD